MRSGRRRMLYLRINTGKEKYEKLTDCYRLSNGVEIPCIGFGTWQTPDGTVAEEAVKAAIAAGLSGSLSDPLAGKPQSL